MENKISRRHLSQLQQHDPMIIVTSICSAAITRLVVRSSIPSAIISDTYSILSTLHSTSSEYKYVCSVCVGKYSPCLFLHKHFDQLPSCLDTLTPRTRPEHYPGTSKWKTDFIPHGLVRALDRLSATKKNDLGTVTITITTTAIAHTQTLLDTAAVETMPLLNHCP